MYNDLYSSVIEASNLDEVPIACKIINKKKQISKIFINEKERQNSILYHCELLAINWANKLENDFRLSDYEIIISTDPCPMCLSALLQTRISKITILSSKKNNEILLLDNYIKKFNTIIQYDIDSRFEIIIKKFFKSKRNMV